MNVIDMSGLPPAKNQGLLSQPVASRPIAMIAALDPAGGVDVAPDNSYTQDSSYTPVGDEPPLTEVTVRAQRRDTPEPKDTWHSIARTVRRGCRGCRGRRDGPDRRAHRNAGQ